MAITERYTSRSQHITAEGTTLLQTFVCSANSWNDWISLGKPVIGTQWSFLRQDLRVTDIQNNWLSNTDCEVFVTYSTRGMYYPQRRVDKVSNQREVFDFQFNPHTSNGFVDVFGDDQEWHSLYNTYFSVTLDPADVPPIYPEGYLPTVTRTCNVSEWYWYTIKDRIGGINNNNWISTWTERFRPKENIGTAPFTDNDTGKWLFSGFHAEKLGYETGIKPNYELQYTFTFYDKGWNTPYGVTNIKLYPVVAFGVLPRPTDYDDSELYDLR